MWRIERVLINRGMRKSEGVSPPNPAPSGRNRLRPTSTPFGSTERWIFFMDKFQRVVDIVDIDVDIFVDKWSCSDAIFSPYPLPGAYLWKTPLVLWITC